MVSKTPLSFELCDVTSSLAWNERKPDLIFQTSFPAKLVAGNFFSLNKSLVGAMSSLPGLLGSLVTSQVDVVRLIKK